MTTTARATVLFMAFPSAESAGLEAWRAFRDLISRGMAAKNESLEPVRPAMPRGGEIGIWRLLASNNREVGRSANLYGSFEAARAVVVSLQEQSDGFEVVTFHGPSSGMHGWLVSHAGIPVLTCARWYETASISLEVSGVALAALRRATVTETPWQAAAAVREARRARPAVARW